MPMPMDRSAKKIETAYLAFKTAFAVGVILALLSTIGACDDQKPRAKIGVDMIKPFVLYGGAGMADYASTKWALGQNSLLLERNPLGPELGPLTTFAALMAADLVLQKTGHPRWVKALRIVGVAAGVGFALNNVIKGKR